MSGRKRLLIAAVIAAGCVSIIALFRQNQMPAPFSMLVMPESIRGGSIPGQRLVFLVTVADEGRGRGEGGSVNISASLSPVRLALLTIEPSAITQGQVAEITVIPGEDSAGDNITITVRGERQGLEQMNAVTFSVLEGDFGGAEGQEELQLYAAEIRQRFVVWLALNHPELGITNKTEWIGTIVSPQWLVVTHYLFFSEGWEMHVSWHVMIPPYDWARIDLRHRFIETSPSYAFEISSRQAVEDPKPIDPTDSVWR